MCNELQGEDSEMLLLTPNSRYEADSTKLFVPNPARTVAEEDCDMLRFLGLLMGNSVLNRCPLALDLSRFFYQKLGGELVSEDDYRRDVDNLNWLTLEKVLSCVGSTAECPAPSLSVV